VRCRSSIVALAALCVVPLAAQEPSTPAPSPPKRTVEFTGLVLINAFYNNVQVNNSDVPQFVAPDTIGVSGGGGSLRQTRLGVLLTEQDVLGGTFTGEVDADFFGGQQASTGGRTFPLIRLRRAVATVQWTHTQILFGQESPLVAERSPRSLASVGFPDFAGAGNLWLWLPQARGTVETGYTLRLALQGAVLAPTSGAPQGTFQTQPDSAERTGRPSFEGRLRLGWGQADDPSEIAVGGHFGWQRNLDSLSGDSLIKSKAITVDARIKLGVVELIGEGFSGQALAGLGGGGIGQSVGVGGAAVRTRGGWGQLNIRPVQEWMFGGGCGLDNPDDSDVLAGGRLKNLVCEGHVQWRPSGPLVFGFEFRRLKTSYAIGDFAANHFNAAAGFRF